MLTTQRKALYREQRTVAVKSEPVRLAKVKAHIAAISKELAGLRREVRLCDDIAVRSGVMREKIKAVREDEQSKGKEKYSAQTAHIIMAGRTTKESATLFMRRLWTSFVIRKRRLYGISRMALRPKPDTQRSMTCLICGAS